MKYPEDPADTQARQWNSVEFTNGAQLAWFYRKKIVEAFIYR